RRWESQTSRRTQSAGIKRKRGERREYIVVVVVILFLARHNNVDKTKPRIDDEHCRCASASVSSTPPTAEQPPGLRARARGRSAAQPRAAPHQRTHAHPARAVPSLHCPAGRTD